MSRHLHKKAFSIAGSFMLLGSFAALPASAENASGSTTPSAFKADGSSSENAAASCFEIKKNNPSAKSGSYWLYTSQMSAPAQFYCDQETDGGGWVLIGRGREGWSTQYTGKGKASDLASNPDGTDAFSPVQLSSETVNELLGGKAPKDLANDALRIKRASNQDGSQSQEIRIKRAHQNDWSWELSMPNPWSNLSVSKADGSKYTYAPLFHGNIAQASSNSLDNIIFSAGKSQGWNNGFGYGATVKGSTSASSYLWSATEGGGSAIPFSQMFMRPELTQADVSSTKIPDAGTVASTRRALPNSYSEPVSWRTSEETASGVRNEMHTFVQAIDQVGDTVFTAGDFKYVENAATGEKVNQSYIAGYNVNTGELVRSFMPTFNGQIKSLAALPDGKLAVGGEFTQVNGQDHAGIVVLDPATGAVDSSKNWGIESRGTNGTAKVKSMDVQGDYLYLGGTFTHVKDGKSASVAYSKNAARINLKTGNVDSTWRPVVNGTVTGISSNAAGTDVYISGYFSEVAGQAAFRIADLNTTDGKLARNWSWEPSFTSNAPENNFQLAIDAGETNVWVGGSEHMIHSYDPATLTRTSSSITRAGGDFQDILVHDGVTFGSCHCGDAVYQGTSMYPHPTLGTNDVHQIRLVGAFDEKTGNVIPEFNPQISGAKGFGVWEQFIDSKGTLWVGGEINSTMGQNGNQRTVGFARFAPRDVTPAATPTNLKVDTKNGKDQLTWNGVSGSGIKYQVLRNDRPIATTTAPNFAVDHQDGARYFVRTIDASGNYSASTPVAQASTGSTTTPSASASATTAPTVAPSASSSPTAIPTVAVTPSATATPTAQPTATTAPATPKNAENASAPKRESVISQGSTWNYALGTAAPAANWNALNSTSTGWKSGKTALGWGTPHLATAVNMRRNNSVVSLYARKEFTLTNLDRISNLTLSTYADDGLAVYVNGQEVSRTNLPQGKLAYNQKATANTSARRAQSKPVQVVIPAEKLREGKNVIAVEVHSAGKRQGLSFDLAAQSTGK